MRPRRLSKCPARGRIAFQTNAYRSEAIFVNAVAPGAILTPAMQAWPDDSFREQMMKPHLILRMGMPDDVSSMVAYLAGESTFIAGRTIPVDGGWTTRGVF